MEGTAAGFTSSTLSRSSTVEEGDFLEGAEAKLKLIQKSSKAAVWRTKFALLGLSLFFFLSATAFDVSNAKCTNAKDNIDVGHGQSAVLAHFAVVPGLFLQREGPGSEPGNSLECPDGHV